MSESTTLMYAELLSNIRQISVIAALDSPSNSSTRAELSSDGQQFLLRHEGQATILKLPVAASPSFRLQPPAIAAKELSWRLPLAGEPKSADTESTDAPWPAKDLSESTEFLCRNCGGVIIGKGRVKEWRDLPSENWAEMMDFWHCHKPSFPQPSGSGHSHHDPATSRGYGANTKFSAQSGIGFVDLTTLLVAEADCTGVKPKQPPAENKSQYQRLLCKTCDTTLGQLDIQAEGYRLYKWRLKTQSSSRSATSTPTCYKPSTASFIAAQLRSIMLAQCSSRLLLVPVDWTPMPPIPTPPPAVAVSPPPSPKSSEQANPTVVYLWIMNPDLRYSSTVTPSSASAPPGAIPAMKTFFTMPFPSDARTLSESEGVEEVRLPEDAIKDILDSLRGSMQSLPLSSRTFRDRDRVQWMVGLLERFER